MYKLPANADFSFLVSAELTQICVGSFELVLNFDLDVAIQVWSRVEIAVPKGSPRSYESSKDAAADLVALLGSAVSRATSSPDGTLTIDFGAGATIRIFDDSTAYESYTVRNRTDRIVV